MTVIDMSKMPPPTTLATVDFSGQLDTLLQLYVAGMRVQTQNQDFPEPLPADPAYQILSAVAYTLTLKNQQHNEDCLANLLAYAAGVDLDHLGANIGVARLDGESDERYRSRIQRAPEAWSVAGSRGSYEYHALSASLDVLDVLVDRPVFRRSGDNPLQLICTHDARLVEPLPGDVAVTVLPALGSVGVLPAVELALDPLTVVPFTDTPRVMLADEIVYEVIATLYFYPGPSAEPAVAQAKADLASYTVSHYRLGHDIAVSGLFKAAHQNGCQRVMLNITSDIVVQPWQVARCTGITVLVGGRDV